MRYFSTRSVVSALVCCFLLVLPLAAQKITGDISGTVTDTSGAVVKDATITAKNTATGETRSAMSSDAGFYRILELPPGVYKVTVTAQGFKTTTRDAQVALALVTASDFQLQIGQVSEVVQVEEAAPLVDTSENRLSTLIEARRVNDLPNNGRDFNNLLDGVPGVQRSPGGGFQSLNINGQRATSNNFAIDGIPNNDRYYGEPSLGQAAISGTAAALIPLDGISEFNVESSPGVEFGVKGGSVINVGLKSGTNSVHGSAYWDRHTDAFDAVNHFSTTNTPFKLNQFGGSVGFPIMKDKAFGFISYQGFHLKDQFPAAITLPTTAQIFDATQCVQTGINPNTSHTMQDIPDPMNPGQTISVPWTTCLNSGPGPGSDQIFGTADDGTVSSIGANMLSFIPTSATGTANVVANNALDLNNFHVKFDYIFNPSHRISVKYLFGDSLQSQPATAGVPQSTGPLATGPDMWNSVAPSRAQLAGINYTWTISPNKVLESRFGYQRFAQRISVNNTVDPNALGINTGPLGSGPDDKENLGVPSMYYLGYFGPSGYPTVGGIQGYPIITRPDASFDWQEHFTMTKGNHTIKIGGQYQDAFTKSRRDRARSNLSFYSYGFYYCSYYGACDSKFNGVTQSNGVAALNELLLGMAEDSGRSFGTTDRHIFQKSLGIYAQDSWKVKANFTLEVGLRWDVSGALGERGNIGSNFLPGDSKADANGFVTLAQQPLYNVDKNNFGPRVGIAWDLFKDGKTVLRSGYSLGYDLPNFASLHAPQTSFQMWSGARAGFFTQSPEGNFPLDFTTTPTANLDLFGRNSGTDLCAYFFCFAPGVPIYGPDPTNTSPLNVVQVVRNFQTPQNHSFNLTIEQQLSSKTSFSIAYVGTAGRDLINWRDLNACPVSTETCTKSGHPNRQPFTPIYNNGGVPIYNHILQLNNDGYSNYNSFQASYKVRDVHGITGQLNYVWSKSLDTGSANRGGTFLSDKQSPYDISNAYAPSDFDTPWNVNFTLVYQVPKFHHVNKFLGEGWQINSLFRAQAGRPFSIITSGDPSNQGLKNVFAVYNGDPLHYDNHYEEHGKSTYFNVDAFSDPEPGQVGNARNVARQPGISQLDMGIFKSFKFTERFTFKFKWEVFNVLNHAMFATSTPQKLGSSGIGTFFATPDVGIGLNPVLGTGAQRNMQFGVGVEF